MEEERSERRSLVAVEYFKNQKSLFFNRVIKGNQEWTRIYTNPSYGGDQRSPLRWESIA